MIYRSSNEELNMALIGKNSQEEMMREYERRYYNQSAMQNMANAHQIHNIGNYHQGEVIIKSDQIAQAKRIIAEQTAILERLTLDEPHPGPTNRELNAHESLANAWSEYLTIRKLALGK